MFGLMGQILRVNLTDRKIFQEEIPEETAKKYLGGRGLASKYLFDEVKPKISKPLSLLMLTKKCLSTRVSFLLSSVINRFILNPPNWIVLSTS